MKRPSLELKKLVSTFILVVLDWNYRQFVTTCHFLFVATIFVVETRLGRHKTSSKLFTKKNYKLPTNLLQTSYKLLTNVLQTFYKKYNLFSKNTNFLQIFNKLPTNFSHTSYKYLSKFLQTSHILLTNIFQNSFKLLTSFL